MSGRTGSDIAELLRTFPMNHPVSEVILDGQELETSNFVNFDAETGVAVFRNNGDLRVFDERRPNFSTKLNVLPFCLPSNDFTANSTSFSNSIRVNPEISSLFFSNFK